MHNKKINILLYILKEVEEEEEQKQQRNDTFNTYWRNCDTICEARKTPAAIIVMRFRNAELNIIQSVKTQRSLCCVLDNHLKRNLLSETNKFPLSLLTNTIKHQRITIQIFYLLNSVSANQINLWKRNV